MVCFWVYPLHQTLLWPYFTRQVSIALEKHVPTEMSRKHILVAPWRSAHRLSERCCHKAAQASTVQDLLRHMLRCTHMMLLLPVALPAFSHCLDGELRGCCLAAQLSAEPAACQPPHRASGLQHILRFVTL